MPQKDIAIINGFRKCGLVPFNPEAIDYESFPKPKESPPALDHMSGASNLEEPHIVNLSDLQIMNVPNEINFEIIEPVIEPVEASNIEANRHHEIDGSVLLNAFNSRLPSEQLKLYKQHRNKLIWPGTEGDRSLFLFWRKLMDEVEGPPEYLVLDSPYYDIATGSSMNLGMLIFLIYLFILHLISIYFQQRLIST